ncbi:MAG: Ca2+-binding RTX toxin-like protein [Paracoccaceae bacterium]|jgi:Ca2+-binding RTX toxin-like protein
MPVYTVSFYDVDPFAVFSQTAGGSAVFNGAASPEGTATITDNGTGIDGLTLDDNNAGEAATADTSISGVNDIGNNTSISGEEAWTLIDSLTGQQFQIVTLQILSGPNAGYYTLSEQPLVPGRSYETVEFDSLPDASAGDSTFTYADYVDATYAPDGIVDGTSGNDVIDTSYTGDPDGDLIDANDALSAGADPLSFNWSDLGDETDLRGGGVVDTGGIEVTYSYSDVDTNEEFSVETGSTIYTETGEPFDNNSAGYLFANGSSNPSFVSFDFDAVAGSGYQDGVENLQFRISDIDGLVQNGSDFEDILTITALDENGQPIDPANITITSAGDVQVSGNIATGVLTNVNEGSADGSILVEIAGPVSQVTIEYANGGTTQQAIYISDLHFDAVEIGSDNDEVLAGDGNDIVNSGDGDDIVYGQGGNDVLTGGQGADTLDGGDGDDTLNVGSGDTAIGGDGDDLFLIDAAALNGGVITVEGGETGETLGDTLDFNNQLVDGSLAINSTPDNAGGFSGNATLTDGTVVNFQNIETFANTGGVICFAQGTRLMTPYGARRVQEIKVGDLVLTRDHGPQPVRWVGQRQLFADAKLAPITFQPGSLGNQRKLRVSPQHRMLISDYRTQLLYGEEEILVAAKHLVNGTTVIQDAPCNVCYFHLLFDTHQIVFAEGVATESYHPGSYSLPGLDPQAREELLTLFPALRSDPNLYGAAARPTVRGHQARLLAA